AGKDDQRLVVVLNTPGFEDAQRETAGDSEPAKVELAPVAWQEPVVLPPAATTQDARKVDPRQSPRNAVHGLRAGICGTTGFHTVFHRDSPARPLTGRPYHLHLDEHLGSGERFQR